MNKLTKGIYPLANDCKASVRDGKVIVSYKRNAVAGIIRCRTCKFFGMGRSMSNQSFDSPVCLNRPKRYGNIGCCNNDEQLYYTTRTYNRACYDYLPKSLANDE